MGVRRTAVLGLAVLIAGCGGGTSVSTTTAMTALTTTTTTSTSLPALSVGDLVAPTDVLDGFRFTATALDDDGDAGLVSTGVFVAPDAVACTTGNPAWMSPTLGTLTAIGGDAWWEDGMGARPLEERDPSDLMICPGAPEFWELPLMSEGVFALGDQAPSDDIEGYAITVFTLTPLDDQVVLDQASLWVTAEGWPIRMQVHGTAPGGVLGVQGLEPDDPATPKVFALGFELTDINEGSLMVRSPDGAVVAGPVGEVEPSLPEFAAPSSELQAAMDAARGEECLAVNIPLSILEPLGMEAGLGHFAVASTPEALGGATYLAQGTFMMEDPSERVITDAEDDPTRFAHATLVFAQFAPMVFLFTSFEGLPSPFPTDADGQLDFAVWSGSNEASPRVATWDGATIRYADGSTSAVEPLDLLHTTYAGMTLTDPALAEAWDRVDVFTTAALEAAANTATGDPQALADMRVIDAQLSDWNALGCALLGHAWMVTEDWMQSGGDPASAVWLIAAEAKAQSLLLLFDYLEVVVHYLDRAEVDWLEADGVVLEDSLFPDDTAGEYLTVISRAAQGAQLLVLFFSS